MAQQGKGTKKMRPKKEKPEFDQQIVDLARVTRVTKGGKQLSFRACVVIGDRKGRVGYGVDKGKDVQIAVEKAVNQAKKSLIRVPLVNETIPHRVESKFKAARVMIKPAPRGSGLIAGSSIRIVLELAGVPNASSKMLGKTTNKITNIKSIFDALTSFRPTSGKPSRSERPVVKSEAEETDTPTAEVKKRPARKTAAKKSAKETA